MSRKPARTSSSASAAERRRVLYSGQVQGVGFRYSTLQIARRHVVTGYVRNLADGRVELVVEGEPSILDAFLADVGGRLGPYIARSQVETQPVQNEFSGFDIAF